jgi:hypothetical protein
MVARKWLHYQKKVKNKMANYAKIVPRDQGGEALHSYPSPYLSNTRYTTTNAVASSVITFDQDTTQIEVGAFGGQGCVIRWIPLTETASQTPYGSVISSGVGANYDHYVPPSQWRQFVVPKETGGQPAGGIASVNGLYQRVAIVNAGATASSVLLSEF